MRLNRSWPHLLATGFIGGGDVGIGVLALLAVEHATGSRVLGALAFTVGFVALTLGRSELFTENFLVPVAAVVARRNRLREILRLWAGTLVSNLAGGWVVTGLVVAAKPSLAETAIESAGFYVRSGSDGSPWRSPSSVERSSPS